jgi:hypothetical protein
MKHIKLVSFLLAVLFAAVSILGCAQTKTTETDDTGVETTTTAESVSETEVSDDLGARDFEGQEIRVLTGIHGTYPVSTFSAEEQSGDLLNDALYMRNRTLEARFNMVFKETVLNDIFMVNDKLKSFVLAGENAYEMAMQIDRYALAAGMNGQLLSYDKLTNINLSKPYWNQNAQKDFSINGKLFFTYGDDNLVFFGSTTVLAFNKVLVGQYNLDNPYQLVYDGKWTTDKYNAMCKTVTSDINGDGKMTVDDQWGAVVCTNMYFPNFWLQDGYKIIEKDSNDLPYFNVPGNDKLISLMIKLFDDSNQGTIYNMGVKSDWSKKYSATSTYNSVMKMFADGKSLFASTSFITIMDTRAMVDDFGILPYPKSEETFAGDIYGSRTFGGFPYVVPITVTDTDFVSAIMEALACESYKTVIPVLYDKVLKIKNTRDEDSEKMLDMIRSKRITDLGEVYFWDDIESVYENMYAGKSNDFASKTASIEKKVNKVLDKAIEFFNTLK